MWPECRAEGRGCPSRPTRTSNPCASPWRNTGQVAASSPWTSNGTWMPSRSRAASMSAASLTGSSLGRTISTRMRSSRSARPLAAKALGVLDAPDARLDPDPCLQERLGHQFGAVFAEVDRGHVWLTPRGYQVGTSSWVRLDPCSGAHSDGYPGRRTNAGDGLIHRCGVESLESRARRPGVNVERGGAYAYAADSVGD